MLEVGVATVRTSRWRLKVQFQFWYISGCIQQVVFLAFFSAERCETGVMQLGMLNELLIPVEF
jgi:hypothetical protein